VFRPLFLQASCSSLNQISQGITGSSLLLNLDPIIGPTGICNNGTGTTGGVIPPLPPLPLSRSKKASSTTAATKKP
jgi:hypothetical protein